MKILIMLSLFSLSTMSWSQVGGAGGAGASPGVGIGTGSGVGTGSPSGNMTLPNSGASLGGAQSGALPRQNRDMGQPDINNNGTGPNNVRGVGEPNNMPGTRNNPGVRLPCDASQVGTACP